MKKHTAVWIILLIIALVLTLAVIFWDPILDMLPIDQSRWKTLDNATVHLNEKGDRDLGWYEEGGHTYYLDPTREGVMVIGWTEIDGKQYYFSEAGLLITGWLETDEGIRYLGDTGIMVTGLQEVDGSVYCFGQDGLLLAGWQEVDGRNYYIAEDGTVTTGWLELPEGRYYLDETGVMVTGWLETAEGRFYFDETGLRQTGWVTLEGKPYYLAEDGKPVPGWMEQDGKKYYIREDCSAHVGWLELDGTKYYMKADGSAAKGKLEIDGKAYYFTSTGANIILVNPWNLLPEDYTVELIELYGGRVSTECYDALVQMLNDCRAAGCSPTLYSTYRTYETQVYLYNNKVREWCGFGYDYETAKIRAAQIVAIPGTSEHHLGTAVDITDSSYLKLDASQANTRTQRWLMEHCWEYGFILRYPEGTTEHTGIIYEPWHYRYVGTELSLEMQELGVCLEVYLENLTE